MNKNICTAVFNFTDRILPQAREWQTRPLHAVYPFVLMDCIYYKAREEGKILSRAACVVLRGTTEGYKDILSITVGVGWTGMFPWQAQGLLLVVWLAPYQAGFPPLNAVPLPGTLTIHGQVVF